MVITINDPELDLRLQQALSNGGASVDEFVAGAVREKLEREPGRRGRAIDRGEVERLQEMIAAAPTRDARGAEALMGYGEDGMFEA